MQTISRRQMLALIFVAMMSPFLRLVPRQVTVFAGRAAWLSPVLAFPALVLLAAALALLLKAAPGQGLQQVSLKILGKPVGNACLLVWSVWLWFHAGFLLRSGADRFIGTIFPDSDPWIFVGVMAVLVLMAGLGSVKTLARTAELFRPLLAAVLAGVLLLALPDMHPEFVLPVLPADAWPCTKGSVMVVDTVCVVLLAAGFLAGYERSDTPFLRSMVKFLAVACLLAAAMCAVVMGVCGKTLTARLSYPFFSVVRDLTVFHTVQRFEAMVVGLWVLPDFVLVTMELLIAADNLMVVFGGEKPHNMAWRDGNRFIWLGAAAAVATAVFIARTAGELAVWAFTLIPIINLSMCYLYPAVLLAVGKVRKLI